MSDLTVIEGRNPHEDAGLDRNVVFAVGIETARHFQRPVSGSPARRAADVGAIAGKFAGDDDARNDRAAGMRASASAEYGIDSASVMNQRAPSLSP